MVGRQRRQDRRPQSFQGALRPRAGRMYYPQVSLKRLQVPAPCNPSRSLFSQAQRSSRQLLGKVAGCSRTSPHCSLKRLQVPAPCKPSSSLCSHAKRSPLQSCAWLGIGSAKSSRPAAPRAIDVKLRMAITFRSEVTSSKLLSRPGAEQRNARRAHLNFLAPKRSALKRKPWQGSI